MIKLLFLTLLIPQLALAAEGFVVLELFTSQGCSSCPAADEILLEYQERAKQLKLPIYTVSHHVDYWNYLGWQDPYSSNQANIRQRMYANTLSAGQSFTPQLIINGELSLVGSEQSKISEAIHKYLKTSKDELKINNVFKKDNQVNVKFNISSQPTEDLIIYFFLTKQIKNSKVTAGENSGRVLKHSNSVISTYKLNEIKNGENNFKFPMINDLDKLNLLVMLQSNKTKKIFGADEISLAEIN